MGRTVSYPQGAEVAFQHHDSDEAGDFSFLVDDIRDEAERIWPSMSAGRPLWLGREDRVLLSNEHAHFGISEYCGIVAIWLVVRDDAERFWLADHWVRQARAKLRAAFGELTMMGRFSNGEALFQRGGVTA